MATGTDWEKIEMDYRAGLLSLREIASQHGIGESTIRKRAKRDDWTRDLTAKIKARADDLVRKQEVRKQVRADNILSERVMVEATAEVIAAVRMEHRADIRRARSITNGLFDELGSQCADVESLERLGELMHKPNDKGIDKLNEIYHSIISTPERVKSMKALVDALKNLVAMEREAYDIGGPERSNVSETLSALMDELAKGGS